MPDYGDDRGFRSRGVPADIGFDRAGPGRNYNRGYGPGDVTMSDVPFDTRSTFNRDTPVQTGGSRGEFAPPLYSGRNPFIQPIQKGGRQGEFGGMGRQPIYTGFGGEGSRIMGYEPMDYMEEDMSYMSPSPFPRPGQPWPPIGRPPWGSPDTEWVGQPGGGEGESEFADVGDQYRMWNSIRRKYGAEAADRMMGSVAVNRGGIMGLI